MCFGHCGAMLKIIIILVAVAYLLYIVVLVPRYRYIAIVLLVLVMALKFSAWRFLPTERARVRRMAKEIVEKRLVYGRTGELTP
uniref:Uncharacterized protein n=1 Tax=Trypanosoma vivax (strain Y486) TaxID=1055687 RepID=G0TVA8_TRYVY|nr:conserved hypothetical protein [Trypanosoma vivax Y486]